MSNKNTYLSAIIERDTLDALQELKEKMRHQHPYSQISLSSVVRETLKQGLKAIEHKDA